MRFVPQTLDRVRAALSGRRTPGRHTAAYAPAAAPPARRRRPTPDTWGARLIIARRRRPERSAGTPYRPPHVVHAEWFPPRDWETEEAWERTGALVRPYVNARSEAPRTGRTGAQVDPWGHVQ